MEIITDPDKHKTRFNSIDIIDATKISKAKWKSIWSMDFDRIRMWNATRKKTNPMSKIKRKMTEPRIVYNDLQKNYMPI